jgi:hypothetical protein
MSRRFLTLINVTHLDTAPTIATAGDLYFNTTDDSLYVYNGTAWVVSSGGGGGEGYIDGGNASELYDTTAIDGGSA